MTYSNGALNFLRRRLKPPYKTGAPTRIAVVHDMLGRMEINLPIALPIAGIVGMGLLPKFATFGRLRSENRAFERIVQREIPVTAAMEGLLGGRR